MEVSLTLIIGGVIAWFLIIPGMKACDAKLDKSVQERFDRAPEDCRKQCLASGTKKFTINAYNHTECHCVYE